MTSRSDFSGATTALNNLGIQPNSSMPTVAFTLFPELPTEIRLQIWQHTISNIKPRLMSIESNAEGNYVPSILYTNSEAQAEGLRRYECIRLNKTDIRFDYDSDIPIINYGRHWTLYQLHFQILREPLLEKLSRVFNFHEIQRVALRLDIQRALDEFPGDAGYDENTCLWRALELQLPNLKEITFLLGESPQTDMNKFVQSDGRVVPYMIWEIAHHDYGTYMKGKDKKTRYWAFRFLELRESEFSDTAFRDVFFSRRWNGPPRVSYLGQ